MDVADIFYEYHRQAVMISEEERVRYNLSIDDANIIVNTILGFIDEFYKEKKNKTLLNNKNYFPKEAMVYNRNVEWYNSFSIEVVEVFVWKRRSMLLELIILD